MGQARIFLRPGRAIPAGIQLYPDGFIAAVAAGDQPPKFSAQWLAQFMAWQPADPIAQGFSRGLAWNSTPPESVFVPFSPQLSALLLSWNQQPYDVARPVRITPPPSVDNPVGDARRLAMPSPIFSWFLDEKVIAQRSVFAPIAAGQFVPSKPQLTQIIQSWAQDSTLLLPGRFIVQDGTVIVIADQPPILDRRFLWNVLQTWIKEPPTPIAYGRFPIPTPLFPGQFAGLRVQHTTGLLELCLVANADAPTGVGGILRISKNGVTYAVYLVPIGDPNASPVRIKTVTGIMALRLKT